jgi:uncharacterized protein YjdB
MQLEVGENRTLSAMIKPSDASNQKVTLKSDNAEVAMVDNQGIVTAVSKGEATITATAEDGGYTADCVVTVNPVNFVSVVSVTGVSIAESSITIRVGEGAMLTAEISPANAANQNVKWSSDNPNIAVVYDDGYVSAVGTGSAVITVETDDGAKTAQCSVTVTSNIEVSLNKNGLVLAAGAAETLIANVLPEDVPDKTVSWTSSNTNVATVDSTGKVSAVGAGAATITAISVYGKTATCSVQVIMPVTTVRLNKHSVSLTIGETEILAATSASIRSST